MVMPQATVLGAFTDPTKEYGTVAEIDASLTDATYLYATIAEVDYLTNTTVNTQQVVFRLHDPADKALGIVFEAGKQYTFLLTLGLDGGVITFSVPTVTPFNESAVVDAPPAPWKCGDLINGYTTANYNNPGLTNLCWTTTNLAEVTPNVVTTYTGHAAGERGYYYPQGEAAAACAALGAGWSVPDDVNWTRFSAAFTSLVDGTGGGAALAALQYEWLNSRAQAGYIEPDLITAGYWDTRGLWWSALPTEMFEMPSNSYGGTPPDYALSVRCVKSM
ncbi:hypothetical protein FACS1894162_0180 [Bacteroidia bacterium]|nr:hypothetical protein FACS1894162_0180 [Bacteroidia bacterium]